MSQHFFVEFVRCCSVAQSCPTLCDPVDCSTPGFPSMLKLMSIESVMPSNHLVLCHFLLLLPSIFPSIRVFSSESALHIRWPKYWSFRVSISPSNEYSELISFRTDVIAISFSSAIWYNPPGKPSGSGVFFVGRF